MNIRALTSRLLLLSAAFSLVSCATYAPPAQFNQPLSSIVTAEDAVHTTVRSSGGMSEVDQQRLAGKITTQARTLALSNGAKGKSYELVVDITRYQRGNTAARAFLPGMGDLIIEGIVSVHQVPSGFRVGEFAMRKSFGAPGIYGLVTSMDTIENAFAQGVAQTVTGRK